VTFLARRLPAGQRDRRLIAGTPATVFWANTKATLGTDSCLVTQDLESSQGYTLLRGIYVHYEVLRAGMPVPTLTVLLADGGKTDLAPYMRRFVDSDGRPHAVDATIGAGYPPALSQRE
jgi:hypothetical protein